MALIDFTTYDDIRAALGVSSDDLEDTSLSLAVYETNLKSELMDVDPAVIADYATVKDVSTATRTAPQQWFFEVTRLFATYAVAKQLTASLSMFASKTQTDGKAEVSRFPLDPYKTTIKKIEQQYEQVRARLVSAYAAFKSQERPPSVERVWFARSTPIDVVTG